MKDLSKILQACIEMQELQQKQIAMKLNIAPQTFNSYVKGHRYPDMENLRNIAAYFNIDMNDLMQLKPKDSSLLVETKEEASLLKRYRELGEEDQKTLCSIADVFKQRA